MQSGRQTLASLDHGLKQIHRQVQDIDEQIDRVSGGLLDLQQAQADRDKRMAEIRVDSRVSGDDGPDLDAAGKLERDL